MDSAENLPVGRNDPCPCGSGDKYKHCCNIKEDNLRLLLRLAKRKFRLLPIKAREKFPPLIKEWQLKATSEPDQIIEWFYKYPRCNWGNETGINKFLADADGPAGLSTIDEWAKLYGDSFFSSTFAVTTGNGVQYYAECPPGMQIRNSVKKVAPGIDVRGEHGYGLIPPSIHPCGKLYGFKNGGNAPILPAPQWLLQKLILITPGGNPANDSTQQPNTRTDLLEGTRDQGLFKIACALRAKGLPEDVLWAAMKSYNSNHCKPPLAETQVQKILIQALKYKASSSLPKSIAERTPDLICLADVLPQPVAWLWKPYIPRKMLSMLSGDPGIGKTWLALAIIAAFTRGRVPHFSQAIEVIDVLYLSVENVPDSVIRPRLDAMEGDPSRFHLLRGYACGEERGSIRLDDVPVLEQAVQKTNAKLIVVDPIQSYLVGVDTHRANETRPVLDVLARLADKFDCAILLLRHLTKASAGRAIYRGLGSIDFTGAVRTEMLAGRLPTDPSQCALVQLKSNVGPLGQSLGYEIKAEGDAGAFYWLGPVEVTSSDLLQDDQEPRHGTKLDEAAEFLRQFLSKGEQPTKDVERVAKEQGISLRTLKRARKILKIQTRTDGFGPKSMVLMRLPTAQSDLPLDLEKTEM